MAVWRKKYVSHFWILYEIRFNFSAGLKVTHLKKICQKFLNLKALAHRRHRPYNFFDEKIKNSPLKLAFHSSFLRHFGIILDFSIYRLHSSPKMPQKNPTKYQHTNLLSDDNHLFYLFFPAVHLFFLQLV